MTDGISGINHMEYNERNEPTVWAESPDNQALFCIFIVLCLYGIDKHVIKKVLYNKGLFCKGETKNGNQK